MDDVGTRSIFTPEQVGPHLNNLDRDVIFLCGRTCSGSQWGSSCRTPLLPSRCTHSGNNMVIVQLQKNTKKWIPGSVWESRRANQGSLEGHGRSGDLLIAFNHFPSPALISNVEPYVVNHIKLIQQGLIGVSTPAEVSSFFYDIRNLNSFLFASGGRDWWNIYRRNDCLWRDVVQVTFTF